MKNVIPDTALPVEPSQMKEIVRTFLLNRLRLSRTDANLKHVDDPEIAWRTGDVIEFVNYYVRQQSKRS